MDWVLMVFSLLACLPMREKPAAGNDSMSQLACPKCSSEYVKRVSRVGRERLMSLFIIIPSGVNRAGTDLDTSNGASHTRKSS